MIYVMSDIHGMYDKYMQMLEAINFSDDDTLYILGDVIDRGKEPVKILLDMMSRPNIIPLLGNHEYMAIQCLEWLSKEITEENLKGVDEIKLNKLYDWMNNGGHATIKAFKELTPEVRQAIIDYIYEFTLVEEVSVNGMDFVMVHAGIKNFDKNKDLDSYQVEDYIWERPDLEVPYFDDKFTIIGHTPTLAITGEPEIIVYNKFVDIDCGACFESGKLACLCLDTLQEYYV